MTKIGWKVINGYGPYAYLQESVWMGGGKVATKHIAYLGKLGVLAVADSGAVGGVFPGHHVSFQGERVIVPDVGPELKDDLKAGPKAKVTLIEDQLEAGVALKTIAGQKKGAVGGGPGGGLSGDSAPVVQVSSPELWLTGPGGLVETIAVAPIGSFFLIKTGSSKGLWTKAEPGNGVWTDAKGAKMHPDWFPNVFDPAEVAGTLILAPNSNPTISGVPTDNKGKPLIKPFQVKKLEDLECHRRNQRSDRRRNRRPRRRRC